MPLSPNGTPTLNVGRLPFTPSLRVEPDADGDKCAHVTGFCIDPLGAWGEWSVTDAPAYSYKELEALLNEAVVRGDLDAGQRDALLNQAHGVWKVVA